MSMRCKMKVYVKLFANLVQRVSEDIIAQYPRGIRAGFPLEIELPGNSTLADLVSHLALRQDEVVKIFVEGRVRELDYHLNPGDQVGIFPPLGGG